MTPNDGDNVTAYAATAQNSKVFHLLNSRIDNDSRNDEDFFYGVVIDTSSARASSSGILQYRAYYRRIGE